MRTFERWLAPALLLWLVTLTVYVIESPLGTSRVDDDFDYFVKAKHAIIPDWIDPPRPRPSTAPKWCDALKRHPRERKRAEGMFDCGRGRYEAICRDGKPRFFSQYNQDIYLYEHHFKYLRRPGTYIDIAANEPVRLSNSYFFDVCLGWRGVCAEANSKYYQPIRKFRTCALVRACISAISHNARFFLRDGRSGIVSTNKNAQNLHAIGSNITTLRCEPVDSALSALDIAHADFLSLDVEGHELEVLQGFNWNVTKINVIVTESANPNVTQFLEHHGFLQHEPPNRLGRLAPPSHLLSDTIFLHHSVKWGKPM